MKVPPTAELREGIRLRPLAVTDAAGLVQAYQRNREHLRPTEPVRPEDFFTRAGQESRLREQLEQQEAGRLWGWVLDDGEALLGTVTLTNIVLGPLRSANLGYWIDHGHTGRGLATAAVQAVCRAAEQDLALHRLEAGTLLDNLASQRVLTRCGFEVIGDAPRFLHINGAWRDHRLFQRILNDRPPPS